MYSTSGESCPRTESIAPAGRFAVVRQSDNTDFHAVFRCSLQHSRSNRGPQSRHFTRRFCIWHNRGRGGASCRTSKASLLRCRCSHPSSPQVKCARVGNGCLAGLYGSSVDKAAALKQRRKRSCIIHPLVAFASEHEKRRLRSVRAPDWVMHKQRADECVRVARRHIGLCPHPQIGHHESNDSSRHQHAQAFCKKAASLAPTEMFQHMRTIQNLDGIRFERQVLCVAILNIKLRDRLGIFKAWLTLPGLHLPTPSRLLESSPIERRVSYPGSPSLGCLKGRSQHSDVFHEPHLSCCTA